MRLNAPKKSVFYISIAAIVAGAVWFYIGEADANAHFGFWAAAGGGFLLAAGNYFKGF